MDKRRVKFNQGCDFAWQIKQKERGKRELIVYFKVKGGGKEMIGMWDIKMGNIKRL